MNSDNIFKKRVSDLVAEDLRILTSISEGWFYEYKQQLVRPAGIAKSISAFANAYGGWLFYGITSSKDDRFASGLPGIPLSEVGASEVLIRQSVSGSMSPAAYYEHKIIVGPLPELGLADDRAVIAIHVPQSNNAPHVHSSGKIYRRVADESDPKEETDRHFLDLLWRRSELIRKATENILTKEPARQDVANRVPVVKITIFYDVWGMQEHRCLFDDQEFKQFMRLGSITFDTIYPTTDGYLARQAKYNNPTGLMFSWQHTGGCIDEITIPLNSYGIGDRVTPIRLAPYEQIVEYLTICKEAGAQGASLVDLSMTFHVLSGLLLKLNEFLMREQLDSKVTYKIQIGGMSGHVPFLDIVSFVESLKINGIPVVQEDLIYAPPGLTIESLGELKNPVSVLREGKYDESYCAVMNLIEVFFTLSRAVGVDLRATGFSTDDDGLMQWYEKLKEASDRSYKVSEGFQRRG